MQPHRTTRNIRAGILLVAFLHATPVAIAQSLEPDADGGDQTSILDAATRAGTAAAIVSECRSDAAPIRSALVHAFDNAKLDKARRQTLWQHYQIAESSTLSILSQDSAIDCAEVNGLIRTTIGLLDGPLS
jgi:hypothetical protein